jgi:hypothetical protein
MDTIADNAQGLVPVIFTLVMFALCLIVVPASPGHVLYSIIFHSLALLLFKLVNAARWKELTMFLSNEALLLEDIQEVDLQIHIFLISVLVGGE